MPLDIRLLGGVDIQVDGAVLTFPTRRSLLLLAILATAAWPAVQRPRGKITSILWSDRGEAQARASLRQELYNMRHSLGSQRLWPSRYRASSSRSIRPAPVSTWRRSSARSPRAMPICSTVRRSSTAVTCSKVWSVLGSAFEEWLTVERQRLRDLAVLALDRARLWHAERGAAAAAIRSGRRLLELDPLREDVCRDLMRLLWSSGQRGASLRQYQAFCATLQHELGIEPEAHTMTLHAALLAQAKGKSGAEVTASGLEPADEPTAFADSKPPSEVSGRGMASGPEDVVGAAALRARAGSAAAARDDDHRLGRADHASDACRARGATASYCAVVRARGDAGTGRRRRRRGPARNRARYRQLPLRSSARSVVIWPS